MSKIRIGVFGAFRGKTMMRVLLNHTEAELVAGCDRYKPLLDEVGKMAEENHCKVALYENFDDFIEHDMDAVVLANYGTEHQPYAIRALNKGMHVMSELMACENIAQGIELIEAVERSGKVYTFAENVCYMDNTFEMWRRYDNGDIGEITYGEGEYIHDCSSIKPQITYGDPNHWRYRIHPFFYCTHSLGPALIMSRLRPVSVAGFATPPRMDMYMKALGSGICAAELVTLENGAIIKSIHGTLKREPSSHNVTVYGTKGSMETERLNEKTINVYIEGDKACQGKLETYNPEKFIEPELANEISTHGGSDFYATHFFIESILGKPDGKKYAIDVYKAVEMSMVGTLAYRSQLNGGIPIDIPNFRNKSERDAYRIDRACTTPSVAGDQLLPRFKGADHMPEVPKEAFDKIHDLFLAGKAYEN